MLARDAAFRLAYLRCPSCCSRRCSARRSSAGLALGLLQDDDMSPLLPLVGVLMLLGGFARRAAGQSQVQASVAIMLS